MKASLRKKAQQEMARGRKSLRAAQTLLDSNFFEDAISRAYYAILHSARAALTTVDVYPRTHAGLRQMFALHLIKTDQIEREFGDILAYEQEDRETCDYDAGAKMGRRDASGAIEDAARFFIRIEAYLRSVGIGRVSKEKRP